MKEYRTVQADFFLFGKINWLRKNLPNFRSGMTQNTMRGENARLVEDLLRSLTTQETDKDDEIEIVKVDPGGPGTCRREKSGGTMTLVRHIETDTRLRGN
jgi:hypothetical protein